VYAPKALATLQLIGCKRVCSVLCRRPLRQGLALAEHVQNLSAFGGLVAVSERGDSEGSRAHSTQEHQGSSRREEEEEGVRARELAESNKASAHDSLIPPHGQRRTGGEGGGGQVSGGAAGRVGVARVSDASAGGRCARAGDDGGAGRAEEARVVGGQSAQPSLMSMVVKEPLRKSGWVKRHEDEMGRWASEQEHAREPSLLSVVVGFRVPGFGFRV
jgi:hypothetical protein